MYNDDKNKLTYELIYVCHVVLTIEFYWAHEHEIHATIIIIIIIVL